MQARTAQWCSLSLLFTFSNSVLVCLQALLMSNALLTAFRTTWQHAAMANAAFALSHALPVALAPQRGGNGKACEWVQCRASSLLQQNHLPLLWNALAAVWVTRVTTPLNGAGGAER